MGSSRYGGVVGYVGLGDMGGGIATHLARAGVRLVVYDLRAEAIERLVAEGAVGASSLAELAQAAETVIVCVDPERRVVQVIQELAEHLRAGQTVIIQSSVPLQLLLEASRSIAPTGANLVDAPVSGSHEDRLNGTLSVLVGAKATDVESLQPLLEEIGNPYYFDVLGGGEVAKLANNAIMRATRLAATEVMEFAAAYGLSEDHVRDAAALSSGACWVLENWEYFDEQTVTRFNLGMGYKQTLEILAAAEEKGVQLKMVEASRDHELDIIGARYKKLTGQDPDPHIKDKVLKSMAEA